MKEHKQLIEKNELTQEQKKSVHVRTITAIVMSLICLPAVVFGSYFFVVIVFLITGFAAYELVNVSKLTKKRTAIPIYIVTIILMESFVFWIFIKNNLKTLAESEDVFTTFDSILTNSFTDISISIFALLTGALFYFIFSFSDESVTIGHVMYYIAMTTIVGISMQSLMYLRFSPFESFKNVYEASYLNSLTFRYAQSWFLLIYVVIGVFGNDIFAFFAGILFGKHKVNPRISPKKTWEGFIGGWLMSTIISVAFALIMSTVNLPISPVLDLDHWYWVLLISSLMPVIGDLGDFVFSAIKRNFRIKDFSNLLPGHGGILDRIDSLLFGSCLVSVLLVMITNGWNFLI